MKKIALLVFTFFALYTVNLSAGALDLPLNPENPTRAIRCVLTELAENLNPHVLFEMWQFEEAALVLIPNSLKTALDKNESKLTAPQIAQTRAAIAELEICAKSTVLADPTPTLRRTKPRPPVDTKKRVAEKPQSLIPILLQRAQTKEDRLTRKFSSTAGKKTSLPECTRMPQRGLHEDALKEIIDLRLHGLLEPSGALSYKDLILWANKKCGMRINPTAYPTLATLLTVITVNLKIFLNDNAGKSDVKTRWTVEQIYTFLSKLGKTLDMWELGPVQAAVDDILAFVKLPPDPESPTGVTAF